MSKIKMKLKPNKIVFAVASLFLYQTPAMANEITLPRIDVIGVGEHAVAKQPGSVAIIKQEKLELLQPLSTQDALKSVPGIVIREEEGYGFIPNIGMRGLNPNRSQKLLVLEDGVPIAPGLFLANESYYSPRIERMQSIEVLKGAAGLRYGPTTIGGVINYKTKDPEQGVKLTTRVGTHGFKLLGVDAGGATPSGEGVAGISVVTSRGDGFRSNGFDLTDIVAKGGLQIGDNQWLSAKFSYYDNEINTSYVGLRPNEYQNNPTKNPAPNDYFITDRKSFDINHEWDIASGVKLNTLLYWSNLTRDFWRRDIATRTANGTNFVACGIGSFCMTGRNREFEMLGLDSRLFVNHDTFGIKNESEIGVRIHRDTMSNKTVRSRTNPNARSGELTGDDTQTASGIALYAQNRFILNDKVAITPGLRVESYDQRRKNELNGISGSASNTEVIPGLGATWQFMPEAQIFAGAFKGFSPAMVATAISGDGIDQQLDAERSKNYEIGVRGASNRLTYEATLFHMDFDNQIVNQALSAGINQANGGKTLNQGLEVGLGYEFGSGWSLDGNATYVAVAKFKNNSLAPDGNRIPYSPKLTSNLNLNYKFADFKASIGAYYVSEQYANAANTKMQNAIGTLGEMPGYTTFNLNAYYDVDKHWSVFGTVRNLFDKKYITSRNPDGIFPGVERNAEIGASYKF
ncbi:MAG: TonB-dependent siderophore receptor [Methylotenera sp.]|nr:TonB-dependent siderophore receptor [Methylotenera sp.]MDO9232945.1 TonB-dependent siderophore receptor [Methylotenera sp.]MDO9388852.1 TonB-dependent siderophore receptor [Methylotenera sp.]MDP2102253.1 TonB-dependent siderophore receptor [Methylotenera sp.]MDP2281213.1 TonB-dependent siderophore receptor [Methylotenera sp.]